MFDETILYDRALNEETLRQWAFDESLTLSEQDEDLLLGSAELLPILIPLADDETCPKAGEILSSLDYYLMFIVLSKSASQLVVLSKAINLIKDCKREKLTNWAALLHRRLRYVKGIGPVDRETALKMGDDLLNGMCRMCDISISSETTKTWEIELSVAPPSSHKEWLIINKETGKFDFHRYQKPSKNARRLWL